MFSGNFTYSGNTTVHLGVDDGQGNTWPACGQRIGRYALPFPAERDVDCKKCRAL